jgi:glycosyltransferase involved in cell wall biosynthesis
VTVSNPKLLWHSNAPWVPTGYGAQTALFAPRLKDSYDLILSSFYGLEGSPRSWQGIPVLPCLGGGTFGDDILAEHARQMWGDPRAGMVLTLMDVWVLNAHKLRDLSLACWVPVDHEPAPQGVVEFLAESEAIPIAMSRFGESMLGRLDPLYCPHAVDCEVFKPPADKEQARHGRFPDDAFVIGIVAANKGRPSRKGFSQELQAIARLMADHDNVYLVLHTVLDQAYGHGENIPVLLRALGIPDDRVRISSQYALMVAPPSPQEMAQLFGALDVLVNCAFGEGFGLTVLEAQSCGVPCVVTDFSAMREVCGAGWHVRSQPQWTGQESWQAMPLVDDIYSALTECYELKPARRSKLSHSARQHALRYNVDRVMVEHMLPSLRKAEKRLAARHPITVPSRLEKVAA